MDSGIAIGFARYYDRCMNLLTCKLPEGLSAQLDALARAERRSKSSVLREALEARLALQPGPKVIRAMDLVGHLCGSIRGGPNAATDLATNPEHMRGFGE